MNTQTTTQPRITITDLEEAGFTPAEIDRLQACRARYHPVIEQMETHAEWRRIQFLRWLYQHNIYPHG